MQKQGRLDGFPQEEPERSSNSPRWVGKIIIFGRYTFDGFETDANSAAEAQRNIRHQYAAQHNGKYPPKGNHEVIAWEKKRALAIR